MSSNITLSAGIRANLMALSNTKSLIGQTQGRLSTGLNVASPIDDAVKYFQAKSLSDRSEDLTARKSNIDQAVSTVTNAANAMTSMESMLKQMKGIIDSSRSGNAVQRAEYGKQIASLANQVNKLVNDSSYQGLNLINSSASNLTVYFSEKSDAKLTVTGTNFQASGLYLGSGGSALAFTGGAGLSNGSEKAVFINGVLGFTAGISVVTGAGVSLASAGLSGYNLTGGGAAALNAYNANADKAIVRLTQTISNLHAKAASMGSNVAVLNVRLDFTKTYIDTLSGGADKLTVADLNNEGANLVALQTRQQMGIQSLAFAGQMDQSVLKLLG